MKYGAGILPTRRNMKIRKHSDEQSCPCYGADVEETLHLFQCKYEDIKKPFKDEMDKVEDYPSATTSIAIKTMVKTTIQHLRDGTMIEMNEDNEQDRTINGQLQLDQRATLNGMWIRGWATEHEMFLRRILSRKSTKVWLIKLSILLQNMTHNMWKTRNKAIHK